MKKRIFKYLLFVLLIGVIGLLMSQCKEELPTGGGKYPVDTDPANTPSITSIDPDTALAGTSIRIDGARFNSNPDLNQIAIGKTIVIADSVSSNGTTLWFTTPTGYTDVTVDIKVSSVPSPYWSNKESFYFPPFRIIYMVTITPGAGINSPGAYIYRTLGNWNSNDYPYQEIVPPPCNVWWSSHRNYYIPASQDTVFTNVWNSCETWDFGFFTGLDIPNPNPGEIDVTFAVDMLPALDDVNFDSTGVYVVGDIDGWAITQMTFVPLGFK